MLEAQKLEGFRPPQSVPQACHACEPSKEDAPSLFLGQLQTEFREPLPHFLLEVVRVSQHLLRIYTCSSRTVILKRRCNRLNGQVPLSILGFLPVWDNLRNRFGLGCRPTSGGNAGSRTIA